jgi:hypothetical protein
MGMNLSVSRLLTIVLASDAVDSIYYVYWMCGRLHYSSLRQ